MVTADAVHEWALTEAVIVNVYAAEKSVERTANRLGLGYYQVRNTLRRHGVALPGATGGRPALVPTAEQERMCELHAAGLSRYRIARETGWSEGAVLRALRRRGLV